ncbi:MAG: calcium-binding protein, partial [Vitreimonas sp.]
SGGEGDDYLNGGAGVDSFDGGEGTDRVSFYTYTATQGVVASLITQTISNDGFGNVETMVSIEGLGGGTAFADTFIGDDNANLILAEIGDTVQGNGGDDTFQLNGGPLLIDGGAGTDTILAFIGESGALTPDTNSDGLAELIYATQGVFVDLRVNQIVNDGFGNSGTILNIENVGGSTLNDTIYGDNANGNVLSGREGDDTLSGFGGNDTLNGGAGVDALNGGTGIDTASYADETDAMFIDLTAGTARRGSAAAAVEDTLISMENAIGGAGDDTIVGSGSANILSGGAGADTIVGGGAGDTLRGDEGDDTIEGAAGADTIDAGAGNDTIRYTIGNGADVTDGGAGADTLAVSGTSGNNMLSVTFDGAAFTAFSGGALSDIETLTADLGGGVDTLAYTTSADISVDLAAGAASGFGAIAGIENVTTGSGNDTLVGDVGANRLAGGAGDDTYYADSSDTIVEASGAGVDFVYTSSSTFTLSANVENLTYTGVGSFTGVGSGVANVIAGGAAGDKLSGGGGNDTLIGGGGDDVMNGGSGADTFVFSAGGGHDTINGFDANPTGGQDLLDLTMYGITSADFAARVSIVDLGSDTQITIDGLDIITLFGVNGTGANVITQGDFILGGG